MLAFSFGAEAALDLELVYPGNLGQPDPGEPGSRRPEVERTHAGATGIRVASHARACCTQNATVRIIGST